MTQARVNEMIANDETSEICKWDKQTWHNLEIPEEHRKEWNLALQVHPAQFILKKMANSR